MKKIIQEILSDSTFEEGICWKKRFFKESEIIFNENTPSNSLFFIEQGSLRVAVHVTLEESKNMHPGICDMEAEEIFGESCFLENGLRNAMVKAITDSLVIELDAQKLSEYLDINPEKGYLFFKKLFLIMLNRLHHDNRKIESLLAWGFKAHDLAKHL